tara:strand:+ start:1324 stop:1623 length:300 start_codon:yes stop_codon:yes gene_type:complete
MAITLSNGKRTVFGDQVVWEGTLTGDSSYVTGGETFSTSSPFAGEFKQIDHVIVSTAAARIWVWDESNAKMLIYTALSTQAANTSDQSSQSVDVIVFGK